MITGNRGHSGKRDKTDKGGKFFPPFLPWNRKTAGSAGFPPAGMKRRDQMRKLDRQELPRHIAIIMDGNGRWAAKRRLPRIFGHRAGAKTVRRIVEACAQLGIKVLTLYAFSSENWSRPSAEVNALMRLLREYLEKEIGELNRNGVRLTTIGRTDVLPPAVKKSLAKTIAATGNNTGLILNLALNYGGRAEIVEACRALGRKIRAGSLRSEDIDEDAFAAVLDTAGLPEPDLLIRTSGELRLSNFLLWQTAYCEFYFTPRLWPDFDRRDLEEAIADYQGRERRFGGPSKR